MPSFILTFGGNQLLPPLLRAEDALALALLHPITAVEVIESTAQPVLYVDHAKPIPPRLFLACRDARRMLTSPEN